MKVFAVSFVLSLFMLLPTTTAYQGCGECYNAAIVRGALAQDLCLAQGGSESFCDALFHAEVCLFLHDNCDCPAEVLAGICVHN